MEGITTSTLLFAILFLRIQCNAECVDDITMNCTVMDELFHMCNGNKEHAAMVCPKTCDLCNYVNGNWSEWSEWSDCHSTCSNSTQMRARSCTNPPPSPIGKDCEGQSEEYNHCILEPCPVDGNWTDWSSWSACTVTCGNMAQTRNRTCTNPPPSNNGTNCDGSYEEYKPCLLEPCPVSIGWATWEEWGTCSTTCGVGIQNRNRSCNQPISNKIDDRCIGDSTEHNICMPRACADGEWNTWSSLSICSVTCGGGIYRRTRNCTNPSPSPFGRHCEGPNIDIFTCNTQLCPQTDGGWAAWSSWNTCSVTCGGGLYKRTRSCTNPSPSHVGRQCIGNNDDVATCNVHNCPPSVGSWSSWNSWTSCTATCNGGIRQRYRDCSVSHSNLIVIPCYGPSFDVSLCGTNDCVVVHLVQGRVELYMHRRWGTICDDNFGDDNNGAIVVCRMLGKSTSNARFIDPGDGPSHMMIWLDDVKCNGYEASILDCSHRPLLEHNCGHSEDAGVSCD